MCACVDIEMKVVMLSVLHEDVRCDGRLERLEVTWLNQRTNG